VHLPFLYILVFLFKYSFDFHLIIVIRSEKNECKMISENSLHLFSVYKGKNKRKYLPIRATLKPKIFMFVRKERNKEKTTAVCGYCNILTHFPYTYTCLYKARYCLRGQAFLQKRFKWDGKGILSAEGSGFLCI